MIKDDRLPLKLKFLEYFREVPIQKYAGASIGKHEDTIGAWKEQDTDFADQIEFEKAEYLKKKLIKVHNQEWVIERLFKEHFSPRNELTGAGGKDLLPASLNDLKTNYGELAKSLTEQLKRQGLEDDQPIQDKD